VTSNGYSLAQMTEIDKSDVPGWLVRAQRDLEQTGFGTLAVSRETGSILDLTATLTVGGNPRGASLTVYKSYGRVRIAADGDAGAAMRLEALLANELELVIATRIAKAAAASEVPAHAGTVTRTLKRTIGVDTKGKHADSGWTDESGNAAADLPAALAAEVDRLLRG
jgi:hypothetical protein